MKKSLIRQLLAQLDFNTRTNPSQSATQLSIDTLETRNMLSVTIDIDYSFDTQGFFNDATRREALEDVAAEISSRLDDSFDAITPALSNSWTPTFFHPGTGELANGPTNLTVAQDSYVIYAGGRDLVGGNLGQGGRGGWNASGNQDWFRSIRQRGESGVANNTDFANWGGSITFDSSGTNWYYGESEAGLGSSQFDFRSVAAHEIFHALGFGNAGSYFANISGGFFTGEATVAEYDFAGNVPISPDGAHFAEGTTEDGVETALDPTIRRGVRKTPTALDWAVLSDIGWEVNGLEQPVGQTFVSGTTLNVNGTADNNLIEVRNSNGGLRVLVDGFDHGVFNSINDLVVHGLDGNDEIRLQTTVSVSTELYGGTGDDTIFGGAASDVINGGSGNDNIFGRNGNDFLLGQFGDDVVLGMNGNDTIFGSSGADRLSGGSGNDVLEGGSFNDTLLGGTGNDTLRGNSGDDELNGGSGNDFLYGNENNDTIFGLGGNDRIFGGSENDFIDGGTGDDVVLGEAGQDEIHGGGGQDELYGQAGLDTIFGGTNIDFISGGPDADTLYGGNNADTIQGDGGNDLIFGEAGNDTVAGGSGADVIDGGLGNDILIGNGSNDTLAGGAGSDNLFGDEGNDTLNGGIGLDLLNGGSGIDTAIDNGELDEISIEI